MFGADQTDGTGTSSYVYDPLGELTSTTNGAGQTVGYSYDADGNTAGVTYPLPASATWAASVTDFNGNQITLGYTADGQVNSQALASTGDTVTTTYDPAGNPSAINLKNSTSTLLGFSYSDAPSGDIMSETDTPASSQSPASYSYDAQGRLTSMTPGSGSQLSYGYDPSGDLSAIPTGATGTYDHGSELTSSVLSGVTTNYSYDADGERLTAKQGTTTLASGTWNGAGQLTAYTDQAAAMTGTTYDGNGLRASATFTPAGGSASTQNFVWDATATQLLMDSANAYIYAGDEAPAEQVNLSTGKVTYLATDSLGSVRGTVNSSGTLTGTTNYDAWGNPETPGGLTATTPFGYAGGYTDPTGLIYLINRYYDPATGQFTSVDPQVDQTGEPYAYSGGDPVSNSDPTGQNWYAEVGCHCNFADEGQFEDEFALFFGAAAGILGVRMIREPRTGIRPCKLGKKSCPFFGLAGGIKNFLRIPDIYFYKANAAHPHAGFGLENELKVGKWRWRSIKKQAAADAALTLQGGGYGTNRKSKLRGKWLPIHDYIWWFAPSIFDTPGLNPASLNVFTNLLNAGLSVVILNNPPGQKNWPRRESKKEKEQELQAFQSGNAVRGVAAADAMFEGCSATCPIIP